MTDPVQQLASAVVAGSDAPVVQNLETPAREAVSEPAPDVASEPAVREPLAEPDRALGQPTNGASTEAINSDWVQIETDPGKLSHAQAVDEESERPLDVQRRPSKKYVPPPSESEALIQIETRK